MAGLKYWIWLTCLKGLNNQTCLALLEHFGTPENIFFADAPELRSVKNVDHRQTALLADHSLENADRILGDCHRLGVQIVTIQDASYPGRLRDIYNPPCVLYVKGHLPVIEEEAVICMVGTRNCTPYGVACAERLAHGLAKGGAVVASGLARGIDSAASRGALMGGGLTLGLLGNGTDVIYPRENRSLYEDVAASGALISEYPPGTMPMPGNFPQRNRIMSGVSVGTVIVEAPVRSGALITASLALEQGRDVFAVPGSVDAYTSRGCNRLIQEGAVLVMEPEDILNEYISRFPGKIYAGRRRFPDVERESPDSPDGMEKQFSARHGETSLRDGETSVRRGGISGQCGEPSRVNPPERPEIRVSRSGEKLPPENEDISVPCLETAKSELPETQIKLLRLMSLTQPVVTDDLIAESGLSTSDVLAALTMLEIAGLVCQYSGKRYTRLVRLIEPPQEASQDEPVPQT